MPGGRLSYSRGPGRPRIGSCARARSGVTATRKRRAARSGLCLSACGGSACKQGTAPVWPRWLDDRALRGEKDSFARTAVRGHTFARAAADLELAFSSRREYRGVLGLASGAANGRITLGEAVVYMQSAVGVSMIAFGGFSWALDGSAAPVASVQRLESAMRPAGALPSGSRAADAKRAHEIRLRDVTFAYPTGAGTPVLEHFDLTIPAGSSLAIVGQNGAGKTTIAKLLCRLYDPQSGRIEIDGVDLREFDPASWRASIAAVFQDFIRLELPRSEER